jgi:hypothetical protein
MDRQHLASVQSLGEENTFVAEACSRRLIRSRSGGLPDCAGRDCSGQRTKRRGVPRNPQRFSEDQKAPGDELWPFNPFAEGRVRTRMNCDFIDGRIRYAHCHA